MRVLHYTFGIPPVRGGGLVRYASDLMVQEKKAGCGVALLIPASIPHSGSGKVSIRKAADYMGIQTYAVFHPLPVPVGKGIRDVRAFTKACCPGPYARFLQRICPDMIHVHTFMGLHREFLEQAQALHIPVVFTTHDYFGICPTANLLRSGHVCDDKEWMGCGQCCKDAYPWKKLWLEQSKIYRLYRTCGWAVRLVHQEKLWKYVCLLRRMCKPAGTKRLPKEGGRMEAGYPALKKYYEDMFRKVSWFHFNSTTAQQMYRSRLGAVPGGVEPVSHAGIRDRRRKRSYGPVLRIGYFGGWLEHKGVSVLIEACRQLWAEGHRDMELHIYADAGPLPGADRFLHMHPAFRKEQLEEVMDAIDVLAVPSLWPETFGLVVLEAVSCAVPVVFSKNAGAKDILERHPHAGFAYDGTRQGLKAVLETIYHDRSLLEQANRSLLEMEYDFSFGQHTKRMLALYSRLAVE